MCCLPAAHFFVSRIGCVTAGIPNGGAVNTRQLPEQTLRAPKTSQPENNTFHIGRERRNHSMSVDSMYWIENHGFLATRQCVVLCYRRVFMSREHCIFLLHIYGGDAK